MAASEVMAAAQAVTHRTCADHGRYACAAGRKETEGSVLPSSCRTAEVATRVEVDSGSCCAALPAVTCRTSTVRRENTRGARACRMSYRPGRRQKSSAASGGTRAEPPKSPPSRALPAVSPPPPTSFSACRCDAVPTRLFYTMSARRERYAAVPPPSSERDARGSHGARARKR